MIVKGPKVGRLFPLHFTVPSLFSVTNQSAVWHKRLSSKPPVLSHLLKNSFLGNKNQSSSHYLTFVCFFM